MVENHHPPDEDTWSGLFGAVFEQAPSAVILARADSGQIVQANARARSITGRQVAELSAMAVAELVTEKQRNLISQAISDVVGGRDWQKLRLMVIRPDGRQIAVHVAMSAFTYSGDNLVCCVLREVEDISDEEQLVQLEKLATLGSLMAGVAHEINTPLGALRSNTDTFVRSARKLREYVTDKKLPEKKEILDLLDSIDELGAVSDTAAERIVGIVNSLRSISRRDQAEMEEVDIHQGIDSTLTLISHELKNRVEVVREYGKVPPVECFPNHLNQVFMNILVNASHAIGDTGVIRIRTRMPDNQHVTIAFSDSGSGIASEHLSRIFEPGFTTKGAGVGTGLGLAIVRQIVEEHHGQIDVESEVGEGTTFTITLPVRQSQ